MALKKDVLDKLKSLFKLDTDKLIAAITATDEVDYELPADVSVITTADLITRDENMKAAGKKDGEAVGEIKGKELAVKKITKKLALDETIVGNDIDKLEAEAQKKFKAGDVGLQNQVAQLIADKEALVLEKKTLEEKAISASFDSSLISMFPAGRTQDLKDNERLMLLKNELTFETVEGKTIVKRAGKVVEDPTTHAPLPMDKVIADLFTERKWITAAGGEGGRGGGDHGGAGGGMTGIKKFSQFEEKWKAENPGKNIVSPEFDAALATHTKDVKDFNFSE